MRAALESVAFQMVVYLESLKRNNNLSFNTIIVDGGMIKNKLFLQFLADLLQVEIKVPMLEDMSLYGALLFGIQKNECFKDLNLLKKFDIEKEILTPKDNPDLFESYQNWKKLVDKYFLSK